MFRQAALALFVIFAPSAHAQAPDAERLPTIALSARGTASAVPDMADLSFTVQKRSNTAASALAAASGVVSEALSVLSSIGVAERDVQTNGFSVQPVVIYPNRNNSGTDAQDLAPKVVGYRVSNGLSVRLRDLDKLGTVLDRMVTAGINEVGSIRFTNADIDAIRQEARRDAVVKALRRAKVLAGAAGVKLGKVLSIREGAVRVPFRRERMAMERSASAQAVPVARGEEEYAITVQMEWVIEQ